MRRLQYFLFLPLLFLGLCLPSVTPALMADYGFQATALQAGLPTKIANQPDIASLLGLLVSILLGLLGIIFFIIILYAGFTWMTAMGNAEKVDKAKDILQTAIIGLVLVVAAYAISSFVFTSLAQGSSAANNNNSNQLPNGGGITSAADCLSNPGATIYIPPDPTAQCPTINSNFTVNGQEEQCCK